MRRAGSAVWTVPGIRQARVLFDRDGSAARVKRAARSFSWAGLGDLPTVEASSNLAALAEEVAKVVVGLEANDTFRIGNALSGLVGGLSQTVAVFRHCLVETENRWLRTVEEAAGPDSAWTRAHRKAIGIDPTEPATIRDRAEAALECYLATVDLLGAAIQPNDLRTVELAKGQILSRR